MIKKRNQNIYGLYIIVVVNEYSQDTFSHEKEVPDFSLLGSQKSTAGMILWISTCSKGQSIVVLSAAAFAFKFEILSKPIPFQYSLSGMASAL